VNSSIVDTRSIGANHIENNGNSIPRPHGGKLINKFITRKNIDGLFSIEVSIDLLNDIENIADGTFSPLEGFMGQEDFESVVESGRLKNGLAWTIPIVLDVNDKMAAEIKDSGEVILKNNDDHFAVLNFEEFYSFDKIGMSKTVYQTEDAKHPGVARTLAMEDKLIGGKIELIKKASSSPIRKYKMSPSEVRAEIVRRGWKTVVGFQTRNVPHVAHEMLQKAALNIYDGLFLNPMIGKKKPGDFKDEVIIETYRTLLEKYYPKDRAMLVTLHTVMRYAGPREAIHHAIMRKNFGCSHIIIGRDHAGVGDYYHPFAAQEIFKHYPDLEIQPLFFPAFYYCRKCISYANERNCPHGSEFREELSGTKMRELINRSEKPAEHLMRPEISKLIVSYNDPFVK
jgi:sulfate adenylyltransferase